MDKVTQCICHNSSFEKIKEYASRNKIRSVGELQRQNICSNNCGLCIPYIERMLQSGRTSFHPAELCKSPTS